MMQRYANINNMPYTPGCVATQYNTVDIEEKKVSSNGIVEWVKKQASIDADGCKCT